MPFITTQTNKVEKGVCRCQEHNPPTMIVLPAGTHTWECPSCGERTTFTVNGITM